MRIVLASSSIRRQEILNNMNIKFEVVPADIEEKIDICEKMEHNAIKIANQKVPVKLLNKEVYLLDMTAVLAGTQFRGQFESRMKGIIDECKEYGNIILVIEFLH